MTTTRTAVQYLHADCTLELRAETDLPAGIAGRVSGVALTYETIDSYMTMFARGSAERSIQSKVRNRKLPLLMDHSRTVGAHVGVVASMIDSGDSLVMTADLFDTPEGRAALDYVKTVIRAGASTGFSIGFLPKRTDMVPVEGKLVERFLEIELREVSLTPMPAVPGADVLGARQDTGATRDDVTLLETAAASALSALPADRRAAVVAGYQHLPSAHPVATAARRPSITPETAVTIATMAARTAAVRRSFGLPS